MKALLKAAQAQGANQRFTRLGGSLQDATRSAQNGLSLSDRGIRQVVVFTDAGDESNAFTEDDVIEKARARGVRVHVITFSTWASRTMGDWASRSDRVKKIGQETGGLTLLVTDGAPTDDVMNQIANARRRAFWLDLSFCGVSAAKSGVSEDNIYLELLENGVRKETAERFPFQQDRVGSALDPCDPPAQQAATAPPAPAPSGRLEWLPAVLASLGVLGLLWLLWRRVARRHPDEAAVAVTPIAPAALPKPLPDPAPAPPSPVKPPAPTAVAAPPAPGPATAAVTGWKDPFKRLPETHLVVVQGLPGMEAYYRISRSPFTIGADSQVVDLVVDHPKVSGKHATIQVYPKGRVFLVDEGSSNGTFVDDRRLEPRERVPLEVSQEVSLSRHVRFRLEQPGRSRPAAPSPTRDKPPAASTSAAPRPKSRTVIRPINAPARPQAQRPTGNKRPKSKTIIAPIKPVEKD